MPVPYSTPEGKFYQQRLQAKQRGIDWALTFEEWWGIWQDSGKWEKRGRRSGEYVMGRHGDVGPYSASNVYICLATENHSHAHINRLHGAAKDDPARPARPARVARGWTYIASKKKHPYQVMRGKRYVGSFATQEEAEQAYRAACAETGVSAHGEGHSPIFLT